MKRIYLSPDGEARVATAAENSHYGMAKSILGVGSIDAEDAYASMWNLGWVRVCDYDDRVFAERYVGGVPVKLGTLFKAQRAWLEDQVLAGKQLVWNDQLFSLTAENKLGHTAQLVKQLILDCV
jgi:hypothetical protein